MSCDIEATIDQRPINATIEGAIVNISGGAGGLIDGDYGDIAVSGAGTVWTIENMAETATVTTGTYVSNVNQALLIKARKASAGTITKGQVVYITGSSGTHLLVELARADAEATSAYAIGIAATTITNTTDGFVMQAGRLTGLSTLPTATYTNGQALYLSEITAGAYRVGIPQAPNHGVFLGFVVNTSNGGAGVLDVRMQNYQELEELSDVYVNNEAGNDFLMRNSSNTRWENITPANVKTVLAINNVDNISDLNKPISTATQTALNGKVDNATLSNYETTSQLNTRDTNNRNRANHTGNQAISTITGLQTALDGKENTITAGTISQYYRGDKTFQTLDKTAVGLANVDNTSDANKPISTATQTALDGKVDENAPIVGATKTKITYDAKGLVIAGTDAGIADITGLQTELNAKQDTLVSGTNIKTINGQSVVGSGNLIVTASAAWGSITGTLSSQTDLQTALDLKASQEEALAYAIIFG